MKYQDKIEIIMSTLKIRELRSVISFLIFHEYIRYVRNELNAELKKKRISIKDFHSFLANIVLYFHFEKEKE